MENRIIKETLTESPEIVSPDLMILFSMILWPAPSEAVVSADGQDRPDWIGLIGVATTAVLHLVLQSDRPNPFFIAGACLFWAGFVLVRARQDRGVFRRWGFRDDNLAEASRLPAALFAVVAITFALYAAWRGSMRLPAHLPLLLLLYPLWGW